MKVMVANAPLSYRETIFAALKAARPHFEVLTTGPACLHRELARLSPQVVVCSRVTGLVNREVHAWVELYPNHAPESFVSLAGQQSVYPDMTFDDLLSVLDEAERLLTSSGPPRGGTAGLSAPDPAPQNTVSSPSDPAYRGCCM